MKRISISLVFVFLLSTVLVNPVIAATSIFPDIAGHWAENDISVLMAEFSLFQGDDKGMFRPNESMTKAELATVLARAFGKPLADCDFSDVQNHWARDYIGAVKEYFPNYMFGESRKFNPNETASREFVFVTLVNILELTDLPRAETDNVLSKFFDQNQIATSLRAKVARAVDEDVVVGYKDKEGNLRLDPRGYITRAQVATLLKKVLIDGGNFYELTVIDANDRATRFEKADIKSELPVTVTSPQFTVKATANPGSKAYIDNHKIEVDTGVEFSKEITITGNTRIPVKVSKYGKSVEVVLVVSVAWDDDPTDPKIEANYHDKTEDEYADITGKVTSRSSQKGLRFFINSEQVSLSNDGSFTKRVYLKEYSKYEFLLEARNDDIGKNGTGKIIIERTVPPVEFTMLNSIPSQTDKSSLIINATAKNTSKVLIGDKQVLNGAGDFSFDWTLTNGANTIEILVYNKAGKLAQKETISTNKIVQAAPKPIITQEIPWLPEETNNSTVTLYLSIQNADRAVIGGERVNTGRIEYKWKLTEGINTLIIEAENNSGGYAKETITIKYIPLTPNYNEF